MKKQSRRKFSADFKAKVALEAVRNQQTLAELAVKFDVNPVMISKWKSELLENIAAAFEKKGAAEKEDVDTQALYAQIGQLKVENEFLKKTCARTRDMKTRALFVQPRIKGISVRRQCELLTGASKPVVL